MSDPKPGEYYDWALDNPPCHEMMHALTNILDNYGAAPDTSCVWGSLTNPGPFDVAYLKRVYDKQRRH
jgi:hypothetical protein